VQDIIVDMKRREFLQSSLLAAGVAPRLAAAAPKRAADVVTLGPDKIKLSRLAQGTGTSGFAHSSNQVRQLGRQGLADLLKFGVDNGVFFWDSADAYGTHPYLKEALKSVPREKVVIMTKTKAQTADQARQDLDRFRQEIGTDYLDIVLLHLMEEADWPEQRKGAMDVISEAYEKKIVRTHGCSCHTIGALRTAARTPWVHVDLARINPAGAMMDADPGTVVSVLREMKAAGKGVIGMKVLGAGRLRSRVDECLRYVLSLDCVDVMTIGAQNQAEMADLIERIPAAAAA
jgi:aryl-alcohol dehydrogenase-like predicted oxidoreductase